MPQPVLPDQLRSWKHNLLTTDIAGWLINHLQHGNGKIPPCRVPRPTRLMRHLQLQKYLSLPQKDKVIAEYVWIDGSNGLRSKSKVSNFRLSLIQKHHHHCAAAFVHIVGVKRRNQRPFPGSCTCSHHSWCHRSHTCKELDIVSRSDALCDLTAAQRSLLSVLAFPYRRLQPTKPHDNPHQPRSAGRRLTSRPSTHFFCTPQLQPDPIPAS